MSIIQRNYYTLRIYNNIHQVIYRKGGFESITAAEHYRLNNIEHSDRFGHYYTIKAQKDFNPIIKDPFQVDKGAST